MEPVYLSIRQDATGRRIGELMRKRGYSVKDIQEAMGFKSPQAVYKWLSGKSLPNLDNFLILSRILCTSIEEILVVDGEAAAYCGILRGCTYTDVQEHSGDDSDAAEIGPEVLWEYDGDIRCSEKNCRIYNEKIFHRFLRWFREMWKGRE